jgi:hypothetical protein
MSTLTVLVEQCRYTLELRTMPWMFANALLASVAAGTALWRSTALVKAAAIPLSILGGLAGFHWAYGVLNALTGATRGTAVAHFSTAFIALAALSAAVVLAAACGAVRMLSALFGASSERSRSALRSVPALALAIVGAGLLAHGRAAIGAPNSRLPTLSVDGSLRGQAGVAHAVRAELRWPSTRAFLFGTIPERRLDAADLAANDAACFECERSFAPVDCSGELLRFRARYRGFVVERTAAFVTDDSHGDPRFALRVGARWSFRDRYDGTTRAGGWAVAIAEGPSHIAPRDVLSHRPGEQRMELRVERSYVAHGLRLWDLVFDDNGRSSTMTVYGMNGITWVVSRPEQPRERAAPLFRPERGARRALPGGLVECSLEALPFRVCSDGSNPRIPAGPVWAPKDSNEGSGFFVALITLGAVIPGSGPRSVWCLDHFTDGTGEAIPTLATVPRPATSDPRAESMVLCDAPPPSTNRRPPASRPPRGRRASDPLSR